MTRELSWLSFRPAMYIATKNKTRKTDRTRSSRFRAEVKAKNKRRRQGLKK